MQQDADDIASRIWALKQKHRESLDASMSSRISKAADKSAKMSDSITPLVPTTAVDVYNNSSKYKKTASASNWALNTAGGAAGAAGGLYAYKKTHGKVKSLKKPSSIVLRNGKKLIAITPEDKKSIASGVAVAAGSTAGGYAASTGHREYVRRDRHYEYKKED